MTFWDGFATGFIRGTLVGGLALIIGILVFQIANVLGLPHWVCAGFGVWALLAALAIGRP